MNAVGDLLNEKTPPDNLEAQIVGIQNLHPIPPGI
jgi:hypothetical protein